MFRAQGIVGNEGVNYSNLIRDDGLDPFPPSQLSMGNPWRSLHMLPIHHDTGLCKYPGPIIAYRSTVKRARERERERDRERERERDRYIYIYLGRAPTRHGLVAWLSTQKHPRLNKISSGPNYPEHPGL